MPIHKTVLLKEAIEFLNLKPEMTVIDATLGGGGHSVEILKKIGINGKLIAIDQDQEAIEEFKRKVAKLKLNPKGENVVLVNDNFACLKEIAHSLKISKVDAIIADLGISSDQLDNYQRGFSFMVCGPLDMRMDNKERLTAFEVVNSYPEKELTKIFKVYGEEKFAKQIARSIADSRKIKIIETTSDLVSIIGVAVPEKYKHEKTHFATRTFQALRIEVNQELKNLEKFLASAIELLPSGGRLAVISFHSGEDRIVKNIFKINARGCICPSNFPICRCGKERRLKIITKKPFVPDASEVKKNPRSRSAKLRVAEKI
jgi:16S rRNA (cytosine1402-N4)-methyltransferase